MATAMIYDTLKLAEQLEHEAGFDAARARAMARILAGNTGGNLATREDLLVVKGELEAAIRAVDGKVSALDGKVNALDGKVSALEGRVSALEGKVSALDAKVSALGGKIGGLQGKVGVLYWMTGTTLAGVAALLGIAISIALHVMHLG